MYVIILDQLAIKIPIGFMTQIIKLSIPYNYVA